MLPILTHKQELAPSRNQQLAPSRSHLRIIKELSPSRNQQLTSSRSHHRIFQIPNSHALIRTTSELRGSTRPL